jgi:pimeloyl-ACP methyl ester carboxylesterase
MTRNPLVLIHGYSADGNSFDKWVKALENRGYDIKNIHICSYRTLTNEVTIKDIAEGFDRALRIREGLDSDQPFDAIVHSAGILVIRAWLTTYRGRRDRLKHLIGLAPTSFGSPLASKGRGWLAAIFKGNREFGPDFLEAGDRVLDALELASPFTWDLAHKDLIGVETYYGTDDSTPYVFTFCGTEGYDSLPNIIVNEPGTDGAARWASCPLNTRKIAFDLTQDPQRSDLTDRIKIEPWRDNIDIPLLPIAELNHGTIMSDPGEQLIELVDSALGVSNDREFKDWLNKAGESTQEARNKIDKWQQFIVHAVDQRQDPIPDFYIQLFTRDASGKPQILPDFDKRVYTYSGDSSYRCFHVNLTEIKPENLTNLWLRIIASSGSQLVTYCGYGSDKMKDDQQVNTTGKWDAELDITWLLNNPDIKLFYPLTTTLIELKLNREPFPLTGKNEMCWFLPAE